MSLHEKLNADMKAALKAGEKDKLNVLRTTLAQVKDERIKLQRDLKDEDIITVLMRGVKSRKESLEMYKNAGRNDLAEKEQFEMDVLQSYLPEQMSDEEIKKIVSGIIAQSGASDMKDIGKVMGPAMGRLKGKADGKKVQQIARALLSGE